MAAESDRANHIVGTRESITAVCHVGVNMKQIPGARPSSSHISRQHSVVLGERVSWRLSGVHSRLN
jgi:hypothetical protein